MIRIFGHYVYKALLYLGAAEFAICVLSLVAGFYVRFEFEAEFIAGLDVEIGTNAFLYALTMLVSMTSVGLYQRGLRFEAGFLVRLILSFLFVAMAMSLLFYALPDYFLGRGVMALAMLFSLVGILAVRSLYYRLGGPEVRNHRVLVLGCGRNAERIRQLESESVGVTVVGYVTLTDEEALIPADRLIPYDQPLLDLVVRHEADELVVAADDRRRRLPLDDVLDCKMNGICVLDLLTFFEKETARINIDILHPGWIVFSNGFRNVGITQYGKRVMDIAGSLVLLTVAGPAMLLVTLASLIESRGKDPVLYHQTRIGLNGKPFRLHKFRSMRTDAEADGKARWAQKDDDRVTALGRFIRKTRLDELPQIFNVLVGEMSLVGPRPERPVFVENFHKEIPFYNERHRVKPGVTGWAQLCYEYAATADDTKNKLQYDLYYVKNASLWLDLVILLETVEVVLWRKGAR